VIVIGIKSVSAAVFIGSMLLCGCAIDKQKHSAAGAAASSWAYSETGDRSLTCLTALGAGILKELYDARHGTADKKDTAATTLGCSVTWAWD
jgi:hypothetical protein